VFCGSNPLGVLQAIRGEERVAAPAAGTTALMAGDAGDARAEFGNAERSDWLARIGMKSVNDERSCEEVLRVKNGEGSCAMNSRVKARPLWQPGVPTSKARFIGVTLVALGLLEDQWLPRRVLQFEESTLIILPVYKRFLCVGGEEMGETKFMGGDGMYPLCGVLAAEELQSLVGRRSNWMGELATGVASDPRGVTGCRDGAPGQSILRQAVVATLAGVVTLILEETDSEPVGEAAGGARVRPPETMGERVDGEGDGDGEGDAERGAGLALGLP